MIHTHRVVATPGPRIQTLVMTAWLLALSFAGVHAATPVPLALARPDGQPGDATKPVKVYILAGQSNMVGMGDIGGARAQYGKLYHSADPSALLSETPVGFNERGAPFHWVAVKRLGVHDAKAEVLADADAKAPLKTVPVALGTTSEKLLVIEGNQVLRVTAEVEVSMSGTYQVRAGFEDSALNVATLNGQEVYRKEIGGKPVLAKIALEQGKRHKLEVRYLRSGSAAFWLEQIDLPGHGDLITITTKDGKFAYLIDDAGRWTARNDVTYIDPRLFAERASSPLSATSNNGKSIGPELGFGSVIGTFHDEQVLLIKTAMGNRSLQFDFRPPSSGRTDPNNDYEGYEYRAMVKGVQDTLAKIDQVVPGYKGQGYEIAGFAWFQGHKDSGSTKEEYEKHLVNLINDLRKEFNAPKMKAVVATVGFHGYRLATGNWHGVWQAQMAVGDAQQHPEFAQTVASVDTRDFWREVEESPRNQDYHYNRNAETYLLIGEAMGRAMVRLQGGQAEAIPVSDREARTKARVEAEAAMPAVTDEQKAAHTAAIKPFILASALPAFASDARFRPALEAAMKGQLPAKKTPFLNDAVDDVVQFYQAAGVRDYDWKPFGEIRSASWDYVGFDLPGRPSKVNVSSDATPEADPDADAGNNPTEPADAPKPASRPAKAADVKLVFPAGLENWFEPTFDPKKAGWKSGVAPFGESAEKVVLPDWAKRRIDNRKPATLIDNDVVLLRQTFDLPPLQEGYRYRIRVAGSVHNNMGEGFAIYADGNLLTENSEGVLAWRRQGNTPRGVHLTPEFREWFKDGKVTLAISNYPMSNWSPGRFVPPGLPLSVWIEQQKLPPALE